MPQLYRCVFLVRLAMRKAHQFKLHAPGAQEVNPALAFARRAARGGLAEHAKAFGSKVLERRIHVVNIKGDVMATDVAVARWFRVLIG